MSDWEDTLDDEESGAWEQFVRNVREDAVKKIDSSAYVLSLMPSGDVDVKYAVELGLTIMYDKPLVVVCHPDVKVPAHLRRVADAIISADLDTEAGREEVAAFLTGWDQMNFQR